MCKQDLTTYLVEYITASLDEISRERSMECDSEFLLGKTYALIECLEIILKDEGIDNDELIALEEHYGIR